MLSMSLPAFGARCIANGHERPTNGNPRQEASRPKTSGQVGAPIQSIGVNKPRVAG